MLAAARSADGEPRGRTERGAGDGSRDESRPKDGGDAVDAPPFGDIVEDTLTHRGDAGSLDLTIPLILLVLAAVAVVLVRTLRRDTTAAVVTDAPAEPAPRWVPWFRSPMRGPGWNDPRPPSDRPGEWSDAPPTPPQPQQYEEWTPPTRRSPTHRR